MENELISNETEQKIIGDLKDVIKKGSGRIDLETYLGGIKGACMDFAVIYESSDEIQCFVNEQRQKGVNIQVNENNISVL